MPKKKKRKYTKRKNKKVQSDAVFENEILVYIYTLILLTLLIIGLLAVGTIGSFLSRCMRYCVGDLSQTTFIILIVVLVYYMFNKSFSNIKNKVKVALAIIYNVILIFITMQKLNISGMIVYKAFMQDSSKIFSGQISNEGGWIGSLLYGAFSAMFGRIGTYIVLFVLMIIAILIIMKKETREKVGEQIGNIPKNLNESIQKYKDRPKNIDEENDTDLNIIDLEPVQKQDEDYADFINNQPKGKSNHLLSDDTERIEHITIDEPETFDKSIENDNKTETEKSTNINTPVLDDYASYNLPSTNLLTNQKKVGRNGNDAYAGENGKKLIKVLEQFGVNATLVDTHIGPSVTKYELRPESGVRVNRISNLQQDIKMGLAAKEIRIEAPIPGKNTVGIEVPNKVKTIVNIKDLIQNIPASYANKKLLFALGKDLMGNCVYGELNKMPHLLVAGATGSGKSVCVNSIITTILLRAKPDEVKLLLIDPKKVEFTQYSELPHLIAPVITDCEEANRGLKVIVDIMEHRYDLFAKLGVKGINSYNDYLSRHPEEQLRKMPWIVVIIDELADLMLVSAKEVETNIQLITQKARAAGVHMVLATQRPSVDVISGVIKANMPSRIAFAVASAIDSRTILDQQGADKLLGLGDMLYMPIGESSPLRVQGCFVSDEEVKRVADWCARQARPKYDDAFINMNKVDQNNRPDTSSDPLYEPVKDFVIQSGKASTSFIQRKFSIGYSRAARLMDMLEAQGIIGPSNGSKPREVYVSRNTDEE